MPVMLSESPVCLSPRLFHPSVTWLMIQCPGWDKTEVSLFDSSSQSGKQVSAHRLNVFPHGRNHRLGKKQPFGPKLCCLREGVTKIKSDYSDPLQCSQPCHSFLLHSNGAMELLFWKHGLPYRLSHQCFQRLLDCGQEGLGLLHRPPQCP